MAEGNLGGLSDYARFSMLLEAEEDRPRQRIRERLDADKKEREIEEGRRKGYIQHFVIPMLDPYSPRRKEVARRISREVPDKGDRMWILGKVAQAAKLAGEQKKKEWSEQGFLKRWGDKLMVAELPEAFLEGANAIAEAYGDMGRAIGTAAKGRTPSKQDMKYREFLEGAYQSGDIDKRGDDSGFEKFLKGSMGMLPNILVGKAAYSTGGGAGLATQAGTQQFGPQYNRLLGEGVSPETAASISTVTSALGGVVESAIPVPGIGKSGLGGAAKQITGKLAAKAGAQGAKRQVAETAGSIIMEVLGESGEEYIQAGMEQAGSLVGAATTGQTEGRRLMEVPEAGFKAFGEALGPVAGSSLMIGGGGRLATAAQSDRVKKQIVEMAKSGKTPSRKWWRDMGLPDDPLKKGQVPTEEARKETIQDMGANYSAIEKKLTNAMERDREQMEEEPIEVPEFDPDVQATPPADPAVDPAQTPDVEERFTRQAPSDEGAAGVVDPAAGGFANTQKMLIDGLAKARQATLATPKKPAMAAPVGKVGAEKFTEDDIKEIIGDEAELESGKIAKELGKFLGEESGAVAVPTPVEIDDTVAGLEPAVTKEMLKTGDPEVDRRQGKSHGLKHLGTWAKMLNRIKSIGNTMVRNKEHIPNSDKEKWAVAQEAWRQMDVAEEAGLRLAAGQFANSFKHLGTTQYKLAEKYLLTANQLAALDRQGEVVDEETGEISIENVPEPLRHGWKNRAAVAAYIEKLQRLVDGTPKVKAALAAREKVVRDLATKLVKYNMIPESALADVSTYVHQQVLMYRNVLQDATESIAQGGGQSKMGWMKERVVGHESMAEEFDYNTMLVEPELAWMSEAYKKIYEYEAKKGIEDKYNVAAEFIENAEDETTPLSVYARERGHAIISEREFYGPRGVGVAAAVQAEYERVMAKEVLEMSEEEIDIAKSGKGARIMVMPNEIVAQIRTDNKGTKPGIYAQSHRDVLKSWKAWTLLNPKRLIGYNLRNITGDLDPIIAANPRILFHIKDAVKEMWAFQDINNTPSRKVMDSMRYGVLNSGFVSQEMKHASESKAFKMMKRGGTLNPVKGYLSFARTATEFRENILRYAAYLQYLKEIKAGKISHYGGSSKTAVLEVQKQFGDEAAAAKLSRELLGDYGNLSLLGQTFRNHLLPFWSFTEVNMTRYPHILKNSFQSGKGRTATSAVLGKIAAFRIGAMYGHLWAWNNLVYPMVWGEDDEKKLGDYDRNGMHILLGHNSDGSVNVFRNVGAISELMSWFGVNEALSLLPRAVDGQIEWSELGGELATAPIEKMIAMFHPGVKSGYEWFSGKSPFPDPFDQRAKDKLGAMAGVVGLEEEAKALRGVMAGTGETLRPHYLQRAGTGMGVVDERKTYMGEILGLRSAYLESKGKETFTPAVISEYKPARDAATDDRKEAFLDWREAYIERHGVVEATDRFWKWVYKQDPVVSKLNDFEEWEFEYKFLTKNQREKYQVVKQTAHENQVRMARWWGEGARRSKK